LKILLVANIFPTSDCRYTVHCAQCMVYRV